MRLHKRGTSRGKALTGVEVRCEEILLSEESADSTSFCADWGSIAAGFVFSRGRKEPSCAGLRKSSAIDGVMYLVRSGGEVI